jgi:F-type H+-transporting ATPase subunit a
MPKINIFPEKVLSVGGVLISNTLLSSILTSIIIILGIMIFKPKFLKVFVYWIFNFTDKVVGDRAVAKRIFPLAATFFIFIGISNIFSILPGFLGSFYLSSQGQKYSILRSPNSDLSITLALALVSVVATEYYSISILGFKKFAARFINLASFSLFFTGIFEFISEMAKIISFSFRLFGNILAGEIILLVAALFTPVFLPLPFLVLETFVGIIQAFIFFVLTASFVRNATLLTK